MRKSIFRTNHTYHNCLLKSSDLENPSVLTGCGRALAELDLHLSRERAALAPLSRISGAGHSGPWPPLHCGDPTKPAPEAAPGTPLHSEALSPECGREHQETGDGQANPTCRSRALGTIGANCSWAARATTLGPPLQPHGWVRLGPEVSRFPDFCEGGPACAQLPRGAEIGAPQPHFFLHILKKKLIKKEYCRRGPHPPQVTSPRARPPLVKGVGHIGPPGTPGSATPAHGLHCTAGTRPTRTGGCSRHPIAL